MERWSRRLLQRRRLFFGELQGEGPVSFSLVRGERGCIAIGSHSSGLRVGALVKAAVAWEACDQLEGHSPGAVYK